MDIDIKQEIKRFISIREADQGKLHIDFDNMCALLYGRCNIKFSPAELEKSLRAELPKAQGYPVSEQLFDAIAEYVYKKAKWLELMDKEDQDLRQEEIQWVNQTVSQDEKSERMAEVYRRRAERRSNR